jgi:hypothetical protein
MMKRFLFYLSTFPESHPQLPKLPHLLSAVRLNLPEQPLQRNSGICEAGGYVADPPEPS